jgi:hypothetical protein
VTAASAWLPHSRPALAAPVILISEVLLPEGDSRAKKSDAQLCSLLQPEAETVGRASRRHQRMAQIAHAELAPHRHGHHGRSALAKAKPAKIAHAGPTEATPDLHAVQ